MSASLPADLEEVVEDLVEEKVEEVTADLREENEQLRERVDELEDKVEDLEQRQTDTHASVIKFINDARGYTVEGEGENPEENERLGLKTKGSVVHKEAENVGQTLYDTVQRTEENTALVNFREKRSNSQQVEDKYLSVLQFAREFANSKDVEIARLGYKQVAEKYGCAYKNDGYRVMEEMAERIPGVQYKESRTLSYDDAMGVGGKHIEIQFQHPDLRGWIRAHEEAREDQEVS